MADARALRLAADKLRAGDAAGAEAAFAGTLLAVPDCPDALLGMGIALSGRGELAGARDVLSRCCALAPDHAEARDALGIVCSAAGDHDAAEAAFAEAGRLQPGSLDIALRRIAASLAAGTAAAELARLEALSAADPLDCLPLVLRGALLRRLGREDEAVDLLELATTLDPADRCAALEYAVAVTDRDPPSVAEAALRRAMALDPGRDGLRNNLAVVLMRLHRYREARDMLAAVIAGQGQGPEPELLCNLSNALVSLGLQDEALATARRATTVAPGLHLAWRAVCNALAYHPGTSGGAMLHAAMRASDCAERAPVRLTRTPEPERRLRVGLLSALLKTHPVGWLTIAGLEHLDRERFEIVCIAQPRSGDPIARRFQAVAAEWHVALPGQEAIARQAQGLDLDVLIDLGGYGDRGLMTACAHRLAPVQVKWVGMQNHSSGLAEMDWFLTDPVETPDGFERFYSERLLRLPDGYVCYSPPAYAPDVVPLPALQAGFVTFGCFNNLAKVTPEVIAAWARILGRVEGSRLVLKNHQMGDPETCARLLDLFAGRGIAAERLSLRRGSHHRALLAEYGDIDIVLDPFPYAGGLTTCEALWMGVPTVTLAGETFSSRHAASHMSNVGLAEWVARDLPAYEDAAVSRAADLEPLAALRLGLRERVRRSPLCDAPRFGRSLGEALRSAWREHCRGAEPSAQSS